MVKTTVISIDGDDDYDADCEGESEGGAVSEARDAFKRDGR